MHPFKIKHLNAEFISDHLIPEFEAESKLAEYASTEHPRKYKFSQLNVLVVNAKVL